MNLTIKDLYTTILAGVTAAIYYIKVNNIEVPLISGSGYRIPILVLAVVGIIMCASSGGGNPATSGSLVMSIMAMAGIAALLLILYGLITGAKIAFVLLAGIILLMWAVSTLRHALG